MKQFKDKTKNKKIAIKDKKKFCISIIAFLLLIVILIIISVNKKVVIDSSTNIIELNEKKYSKQIKEYYDNEEVKNQFVNEYITLENQIWMYIYNNINDNNTIELLINEVNQILESDDWSILNIQKYTKWSGTYHMDSYSNTLLFKFKTKDIEPSWILNEEINYMFEKN